MKRQWWMLAAAVVVSCVTVIGLQAEDKKDGEGWVSLFNAKDLTGWKKNEDGQFEVVDGAIKVSGKRAQPPESVWQWLLDGCRRVTDYGEQHNVQLCGNCSRTGRSRWPPPAR